MKSKLFDINFLGQTFGITFLLIIFFELLSAVIFGLRPLVDLTAIVFITIIAAVFLLCLYKIEYGLFIATAELFIGSKGYLFFINLGSAQISIRIGIFATVLLAWLIWMIKNKKFKFFYEQLKSRKELLILTVVCILGLVIAFINKNQLQNIFHDFNAWLYFLYLGPFLTVLTNKTQLEKIMQIFTASITVIAIKSLLFLHFFSHSVGFIRLIYKWGRDTSWGEFTSVFANLYRIFSQAQIYTLIGIFILLCYLILKGRLNYRTPSNQYLAIIFFLLLTTIMLSLSRSFWLALVLGFLVLFSIIIFVYKFKFKEIAIIVARLLFISLLAYGLIVTIINFPFPEIGTITDPSLMLSSRLNMGEAAVSSRWSQLPNLTDELLKNPIFGAGWGKTVTYQSQDPRILTKENPQGWYTTFAFEWGYLDIMLKIGFIGLIAYLCVIFAIVKNYYILLKINKDKYLRAFMIGLLLGLFVLIITHGFSPYLNHPLGIGYIVLLYSFFNVLKQGASCQKQCQ